MQSPAPALSANSYGDILCPRNHCIAFMIPLPDSNFNTISQSHYDEIICRTDIKGLLCPSCRKTGFLTVHGYYNRSVRTKCGIITLRVLRLKCSCGKTHSVLLASIVPYSQILLKDQLSIIRKQEASVASFQLSIPDISSSLIYRIKKTYALYWKPLLNAVAFSSFTPGEISDYCYSHFECQFMQLRNSFLNSHIGLKPVFAFPAKIEPSRGKEAVFYEQALQ